MTGLRPRLGAVCAAALLVAVAAPPAGAATVQTGRDAASNLWEVVIDAQPGERNDLTLTSRDEHTIRVADPVAPLEPGAGCTRVSATAIECTNGRPSASEYLYIARVFAGDGDDTVRSSGTLGPRLIADGGPGNDLLAGSGGRAHTLDGGGGLDQLFGGDNADELTDGDTTGAADADVLDGGANVDTVSYRTRTGVLRIDLLDAATDGEAGEGDTLRAIENVTGGAGNDRIDGSDEPNVLRGGDGNDRLDGLAGNDSLLGERGRDVLRGQAGNDELEGGRGKDRVQGDRGADRIVAPALGEALSCGAGADTVVRPAPAVLVPATCELLSWSFAAEGTDGFLFAMPSHPLRAAGRTVRFRLGCPETDGECPASARGRITLRTSGARKLIASKRLRWSTGTDGRPRVTSGKLRLTAEGARLARRKRGVLVAVRVTNGRTPALLWRIRLKTRA